MCHITKTGRKQLEEQRNQIDARIDEITRYIDEEYGSDNGLEDIEFNKLINERMILQEEQRRLTDLIDTAKILAYKRKKGFSCAEAGAKVRLENHRVCYTFQLVEPIEANPTGGKLSINSPLGQAVIGKRVGDEIESIAPAGRTKFIIKSIS